MAASCALSSCSEACARAVAASCVWRVLSRICVDGVCVVPALCALTAAGAGLALGCSPLVSLWDKASEMLTGAAFGTRVVRSTCGSDTADTLSCCCVPPVIAGACPPAAVVLGPTACPLLPPLLLRLLLRLRILAASWCTTRQLPDARHCEVSSSEEALSPSSSLRQLPEAPKALPLSPLEWPRAEVAPLSSELGASGSAWM